MRFIEEFTSVHIMRNQVTTAEELEKFLTEHPDTECVDAIFIDLCGIVRGKRYPLGDVKKLFAAGLQIPYSIYLLDVTGMSSDACGRGFSDGDPDGTAVPIPNTLVSVPWSERPSAQVLMTMNDDQGNPSIVDPRNVASAILERFAELKLHPILAFELEFYLLDQLRDAQGRPQAPISPLTGQRESTTQVYGLTELGGFSGFFHDVEQASKLQRVPATVATSEFAPGQYEINLRHEASPLAAADHCALLRNIVKCVARRHDMEATFMSKPFIDQTGNGMHVHMSLVDEEGHNVFDNNTEPGSEFLRQVIAGMQAIQAEAMAIFAPNINAYRRFGPNLYVPVNKSWSVNNRSTAYRIPIGPGESRRIEHRIAGADANPYLVLSALLAGAHYGLVNKLDPGPASEGNASENVDPDLPLDWESALTALEQSKVMSSYLGREYTDLYCATKRQEMKSFNQHVSPREFDWYL